METAMVYGVRPFSRVSTGAIYPLLVGLIGVTAGCTWLHRAPISPADRQAVRSDWRFDGLTGTQLTTEHFDIYTSSDDPEFVDFLPGFLESTHRFYASILPPADTNGDPPSRMQTYILANRSQWDGFVRRRYARRYATYRMISSGGFSEGNVCVLYDIGRAATLSVIAHEGLHQYVANYFDGPLPAWLNEGLATYCETVEFHRNTPHFTPQRNTFRINHLREAMSLDATLSLNELLATNAGAVIKGNQLSATATYYAQAWALVMYLRDRSGAKNAAGFGRMLHDIADGTIRIKARAAKATSVSPSQTSYGESVFYAYFTNDVAEFERGYHEFLMHLCWK